MLALRVLTLAAASLTAVSAFACGGSHALLRMQTADPASPHSACRLRPLHADPAVHRRRALALLAAPVFIAPQPSSAAKAKRGASNGRWAQHYDEFTDEELEGFTETGLSFTQRCSMAHTFEIVRQT